MLETELQRLQNENQQLRERLSAAERQTGVEPENWLAELIGGSRTNPGSPFDIMTRGGVRIEVKYSARKNRWWWTNLIGGTGRRQYDRLLLIGEPDAPHRLHYVDPDAPYVLFDIPFDQLDQVMTRNPGEATAYIQLGTNPRRVRSKKSRRLYSHYQVTTEELIRRYATGSVS